MPYIRKHSKRYARAIVIAALLSVGARAQSPVRLGQPAQTGPTGTVTGHVYCTDTQRPARFADVELLSESANTRQAPAAGSSAAPAAPNYQSVAHGRTALDGSFTLSGVPAGDYYVMATQTGYTSPLSVARTAGKPLSGVPMTHVEANRSADATVSMDRGAVVTGRVVYDDGSPVAGVSVRLRPVTSTDANGRFGNGFFGTGDNGSGFTDDRGVYRASGIAPGKYIVVTTVQTETTGGGFGGRGGGRFSFSPPINVYAPNTQHRAEARALEIRGGETIQGADISVALAGLHSVKGSVESKADAHLLNSGIVTLTDTADNTFSRTAAVTPDGTFFLEYLPPGNYMLSVTGADRTGDDRGRRGPDTTSVSYQPATTSVIVGEHDVAVDPVMLAQATAAK